MLLFPSPNFCMTQSQYSVIRFSSFILFFLSSEVGDNKPGVDERKHLLNIFAWGNLLNNLVEFPPIIWKFCWLMLFSSQLLHDTKSIFYHEVQFLFFYHLKSVTAKPRGKVGCVSPNIFTRWVH